MAFSWRVFRMEFPEIAKLTWPDRHRIFAAAKLQLRSQHRLWFGFVLGMLCIFLFVSPVLLLISRNFEATAGLYCLGIVLVILLTTVATLIVFLFWWRRAWRRTLRALLDAEGSVRAATRT